MLQAVERYRRDALIFFRRIVIDAVLTYFYDKRSISVADILYTINANISSLYPEAPEVERVSQAELSDDLDYLSALLDGGVFEYDEEGRIRYTRTAMFSGNRISRILLALLKVDSLRELPYMRPRVAKYTKVCCLDDLCDDQLVGHTMAKMRLPYARYISIRLDENADKEIWLYIFLKPESAPEPYTDKECISAAEPLSRGIESEMFMNLRNALSIDLSPLSGKNLTSCSSMFCNCEQLQNIDLTPLDTTRVTDMSAMFMACNALKTIEMSKIDTSHAKSISNMFSECISFKSIDLSTFNLRNCHTAESILEKCESLENVILPIFNNRKPINLAGLLCGCNSLTYLSLASDGEIRVNDFSETFRCINLKSLIFKDFKVCVNGSMMGMFRYSKSLEKIDLSTFSTYGVTDMSGLFDGCSSLRSVRFGHRFSTANVTDMSEMFSNCYQLEKLRFRQSDTSKVENMRSMFNNSGFKSLDLRTFDTSKVTDMSSMFENCEWLEKLKLDSFDTSEVKSMYRMFSGCTMLERLNIRNFNTSKVKNMAEMFCFCTKIKYLDLSNFDTSNVVNMNSMFKYCGLRSLILDNLNMLKVKDFEQMFYGCSNLESISLIGCSRYTIRKIKLALAEAEISPMLLL